MPPGIRRTPGVRSLSGVGEYCPAGLYISAQLVGTNMNNTTEYIDLCGDDQPAEDSSKAGRPNIEVKETKETIKQEEPMKHSRLNLVGGGRMCNSVSLPDTKKKKLIDTSLLDPPTTTDPYKQKESPEVFILTDAIERNRALVKKLEKLLELVPNTHLKIKEITKSLVKNTREFEI